MATGWANMLRIGTILEIDSEENTAVVEVPELSLESQSQGYGLEYKVKTVRRVVRVLTRGSKNVKEYFNYAVGEPVVCIFPFASISSGGSDISVSDVGYIAGTFFDIYTVDRKPPAYYEGVRVIDFGGGNYIEVNMEEKTLDINFKGEISINGKEIYLNG